MTKNISQNGIKFNNLKAKIENRAIHQHSTPTAQLLKTVGRIGGLAEAHTKGDFEAFKNAIGDVAVCVINWAKMQGLSIEPPMCEEGVFEVANGIANLLFITANWLQPNDAIRLRAKDAQDLMTTLVGICATLDGQGKAIVFTECLELVENTLK